MNKGLGSGVIVFTEVKTGYLIKQYQDLFDFQKVKIMDVYIPDPEISTILWLKKLQKNQETVLS